MADIDKFILRQDHTIFDAVNVIQEGHEGIALAVDCQRRLVATITDGDIRRAILDKVKMDEQATIGPDESKGAEADTAA